MRAAVPWHTDRRVPRRLGPTFSLLIRSDNAADESPLEHLSELENLDRSATHLAALRAQKLW